MSVAAAQHQISSREFAEWLAFDRIDPIGDERGDLQAATVAAAVTAPHMGRGRRVTARDFMPDFEQEHKPKQTADQMQALMRQFAVTHNARIARGG